MTDLHAPSLKSQFFSSSWGFSWKVGRWFASPGCPQTYGSYLLPRVQSSHGPGPSERWSGTFSFLCSKDGKQCWSHRYFILLQYICHKVQYFVWTELCELNSVLLYYFSFELYVLISSSITHMGKNRSQKKRHFKTMYSMQGWLIQTYFICWVIVAETLSAQPPSISVMNLSL